MKKINTKSYITYRKREKEEQDHWFLITRNKHNKRVEFSFSSENDAIHAWKAHIADNLIDKSGEDQRFVALVKSTDGRWSFQLIYTHDSKNQKSVVVKEELKSKKQKEEPKKEEVIEEEPKKEVVTKTQEGDDGYSRIKRMWVYVYLLLLFIGLGLSIWAFVIWIQ